MTRKVRHVPPRIWKTCLPHCNSLEQRLFTVLKGTRLCQILRRVRVLAVAPRTRAGQPITLGHFGGHTTVFGTDRRRKFTHVALRQTCRGHNDDDRIDQLFIVMAQKRGKRGYVDRQVQPSNYCNVGWRIRWLRRLRQVHHRMACMHQECAWGH
jgi:hypothetical protein